MGKPKNKGKKGQDEDCSDEEIAGPILTLDDNKDDSIPTKAPAKASRKKKNKKKDDDWEEDVASEIAALSIETNKEQTEELNGRDEPFPIQKKKEKKKKKKADSDDDDSEDEMARDTPVTKGGRSSQKATFQMLMMDDDDDDLSDHESDNENKSDVEIPEKVIEPVKESKTQKKKEKKKKKEQEEDIDAILANLDSKPEKKSKKKKKQAVEEEPEDEVQGQNKDETTEADLEAKLQAKVVSIDDFDEEEDDRKKKKKAKKTKKAASEEKEDEKGEEKEEGGDEEQDGEEGSTMKSAAQKRKEKREREKLKKQQDKKKQKQPKAAEDTEETTAAALEEEAGDEKEGNEGDDGEKEGKKKKKKGEKEEKKKKPKAPVAAIKAQLQKIKEEEERLRKEEEERIRKEEEEICLKEEQKRLEEERKLKKKQKEKDRIERKKQEGTYLTEKQKQDKRRALQMLEQMKAQGIEVPNKEDVPRKRPVYFDRKKKKGPQKTDVEDTPSPQEEQVSPLESSEEKLEVAEESKTEADQEVDEDIADAWDAEEDIKDTWDVEEVEKDKEVSMETKDKKKEKKIAEPEASEEEEGEEEDEESEDEDDDEEEDSSSEEESSSDEELTPIERARERILKRIEEAEKRRTTENLRAPVVCVLGHVDTGKTKILDKFRRTNVQDGEAGGITQQIGATNVPESAIMEQTKMCKDFTKKELKVPGLLIIDTPGHESFSNLRSRGSSLCDIAVLVVDIMHGLEPQTIESINLLKSRKTPFIIALNKVDRLYQWKPMPQTDVANTIKKQSPNTRSEFDKRTQEVVVQIAEQGLNCALFFENKNPKEYISLVPTSAHSGDGMGNLIALLCELTQTMLAKRISYSDDLQATVMEVKALHGLGTTIDVILVNGKLKEGETIIVPGTEGPIVTQIRGLLMPQPMKELRVKSQWEHHKEVLAAQGVKIIAKDLDKALAGLPMYVADQDDEIEFYKEDLSKALKEVLGSIKLTERGVFVQASTLGSLEALLEFLRSSKIPYAGINIGPVHKKDIMKASIMLEHDSQYAVILAFDVRVERESQELADSLGVKIFTADIIYHLFDKFMAYRDNLKKKKQEEFKHIAVFPCKLKILPQYIFNSRDPIVCGVQIEAGFVKEGTPLCVPNKEFLEIGRVVSIENNHKSVDMARKGTEVCIKIENIPGETPKMIGRHFEETDFIVSKISRQSIDAVKDYFREDMTKPDWQLMLELKKMFAIL